MSRVTCLDNSHFVPEGWEELDRGVCPRCGSTVVWEASSDLWREDASLRVLVLTAVETRTLTVLAGMHPALLNQIGSQIGLQDDAQWEHDQQRLGVDELDREGRALAQGGLI